MRGELKRLQKNLGKTMIYVTHDQEEAMSLADRIVVMEGGELQQFDSPENIYNRPQNKFVAGFIGKLPMNFIDGCLNESGSELFFTDRHESFRINVSRYRHIIRKSTSGKELGLGIRPEHVTIASPAEGESYEVIVRNAQFFGVENVIEFGLKNETNINYRMTVSPEIIPKIEDKIWVHFKSDKLYLIDPGTEKILA